MALDIVYVLLLVSWGIICLGFYMKDYTITALGSIFLFVWSVYVLINGLVGYKDMLTDAFAAVNFGVAAYIMIRGGLELSKGKE